MDLAILILVIVTVILLGILTFFIFQIWVQSKEIKIQLNNHLQEIQKGFTNSDHNLKTLNHQLIESIGIEQKGIVNSIDSLRNQISDGIESLKSKNSTTIEGLSDHVKLFKDNIEARIKELDNTISVKLVSELNHLTNQYSKNLKEEQVKVLIRFEQTSKEISKKQGEILRAITEPLKINLNSND